MSNETRKDEDYEALGLIGHSYDSLFSIRKRIRKINDLVIPFRGGLTTTQIGTGVGVFFLQVLTLGLVVNPLFNLFGGSVPGVFTLAWLFVPPILAGQNIVKPMPYGKSIPGTVQSIIRGVLDDRVHRRGLPVATPRQPHASKIVHYMREWVMFEQYAEGDPLEAPITDRATEARIRLDNRILQDRESVDLQSWWDSKAADHLNKEIEASNTIKQDSDDEIGARRGAAKSVIEPEQLTQARTGK